jgi:trehalose synthase
MHEVPIAARPLGFAALVDATDLHRYERALSTASESLAGHTWWHVNSTAEGGGVAELLRALPRHTAGAGIVTRWLVIEGDPDFFRVTKRIHNRLHNSLGDGGPLGHDERAVYETTLAREGANVAALVQPGDVVVLHDPQTAGLAPRLVAKGAHVIWVCHVGVDRAEDLAREAWRFLIEDVRAAHALVFSRAAYAWEGVEAARVSIIPPCIDAESPKNVPIDGPVVGAVLAEAGLMESPAGRPIVPLLDGSAVLVSRRAEMVEVGPVPATAPLVVQVSRWDRLKDPVGVLHGFVDGVPHDLGAHLMLAGPQVESVSDDPEGTEVVAEVRDAWLALPERERARTHLASLPVVDLVENAVVVNALQRRADIVVQKSLAEGFGLTVTEAMWKERPVIGSRLGGIAEQIEHGRSGMLVDPLDLQTFGATLADVLRDDALALELGHGARMRVRSRYLAPHFLAAHLELAVEVSAP